MRRGNRLKLRIELRIGRRILLRPHHNAAAKQANRQNRD